MVAWLAQHYESIPVYARPDRGTLRPFTEFFSTYLTTSFDIVERPELLRHGYCQCDCPECFYLANAPRLRAKRTGGREKKRAVVLMIDRLMSLGLEEGLTVSIEQADAIVSNPQLRRAAGYSAYGQWLIRRMHGDTDGAAVLALWRIIAYKPGGSPIKGFELRYADFANAEEQLVAAMRSE